MTINPNYIGSINQAASTEDEQRALFLKVFANQVIVEFDRATVMMDKHVVRTISSGKSAQFPVFGNMSAEYHTPGTRLQGLKNNKGERVITIDRLLTSSTYIYDLDEAMAHYEVRDKYAQKIGKALALTADRHVLINVLLAARASGTLTVGASSITYNGGSQITNADFASSILSTKASALAAGLFEAAQVLDEKDVPEENRYAIFRPAEYYALVQNKDAINRDWGGSGAYSEGNVFRVAGISIIKSNQLPSSNLAASGIYEYHNGNFTNTYGVVFHEEAVGTVKLMDIATEMDRLIEYQADLMVGKYAMGHGILRPECAVELISA